MPDQLPPDGQPGPDAASGTRGVRDAGGPPGPGAPPAGAASSEDGATTRADTPEREAALARVRSLLLGTGSTDEEIDQAVADGVVDLLVIDRMLVPTGRRLTRTQMSEQTGIPIEVAQHLWRALGFLDVDDDDPAFTDVDLEAVELFRTMVESDQVEVAGAIQMARVIGSSMARIADAEAAPGATPLVVSTGDALLDADQFAAQAGTAIPAMARLLIYVWRRHLQAATRRSMMLRSRGIGSGISPVTAVGFADMVGYTMLSQHLGDAELAAVVSRFEELARDTVVGLGGRVVKMIGDEVMFVVQTAAGAAEIGLSLAETYAGDELLSDVRVALAYGPVLLQDSDYYGAVVNLASRLVGVANPGTVLVSDEFRTALAAEPVSGYETRALRWRTIKDIGRVQAWKLTRAGSDPRVDQRRNMRWDRLNDVLRELDDLRARGGSITPGGPTGRRRSGESVAVESGGGDALRPEVEAPLEGGERPTP